MSLEGVAAAPDLDPPLPFGGLRGQPSKTKHAYRRAMSRPRLGRMASADVRRGGNDRVMMRISTSTQKRLIPFLCLAMVAFVGACATDDAPVEEEPDTSEFTEAPAPPPPAPVQDTTISAANISISPVYFDLDESTIKPEFADVLEGAADALRESGASVTIEGHCDERGSEEYNVALGERRANAVRSYLYNLGVPNGQMSVVSYGEARPAVNGTGETAWQLNRRAQFVVR